jgi:hypothetical protein
MAVHCYQFNLPYLSQGYIWVFGMKWKRDTQLEMEEPAKMHTKGWWGILLKSVQFENWVGDWRIMLNLILGIPRMEAGLEYFHHSPARRRRRRKRKPVTGDITAHPVIRGHSKYRDLVLQVGGWMQCWRPCSVNKKIIVAKSKEVIAGLNLAGYSKEGCGSKRAVLPMMMMISGKYIVRI